jgi:hypothetical protein
MELDMKLYYHNKSIASEYYHQFNLQDLPELSRIRIRVEFLFLNYYNDYDRCFRDPKQSLFDRNTIMNHSKYIFEIGELEDLKESFGLEDIDRVLNPKGKYTVNRLNFFNPKVKKYDWL